MLDPITLLGGGRGNGPDYSTPWDNRTQLMSVYTPSACPIFLHTVRNSTGVGLLHYATNWKLNLGEKRVSFPSRPPGRPCKPFRNLLRGVFASVYFDRNPVRFYRLFSNATTSSSVYVNLCKFAGQPRRRRRRIGGLSGQRAMAAIGPGSMALPEEQRGRDRVLGTTAEWSGLFTFEYLEEVAWKARRTAMESETGRSRHMDAVSGDL